MVNYCCFCVSFLQQAADANSKKDTQKPSITTKIDPSYFDWALHVFIENICPYLNYRLYNFE